MFKKYEIIGAGISVLAMATALYLVQLETKLITLGDERSQLAGAAASDVVTVDTGGDVVANRSEAFYKAVNANGNLKSMVIEDVRVGEGAEVVSGNIVSVHYVGTLQDGTEFDNSNKRGEPFEFVVGAGQVIKGWDTGLVGMKVGGQRILVIPPDMAYGEQGIGPIPPNSNLVFSIELLEIK